MTNEELNTALDQMCATMIDVATGGARIGVVNGEFGTLYDTVADELARRGIGGGLPYRDLWQWRGRWSAGDMPHWQDRRTFVADLFSQLRKDLRERGKTPYEPTGWSRVDRAVSEMQSQLARASDEEHFQTVGLLGREILISLGQAVFDAEKHPTLDGVKASSTDAKRMLEAFIAEKLEGSANEQLRKFVRSALDLALTLQHKRTATYRDAALCTEAAVAVAHIVAIVSGRRKAD